MEFVLMKVTIAGQAPTVEEAARHLAISPADIDVDYGVVPIDAAAHRYAVLVRAEAVADLPPSDPYGGPFADPEIGPAGPPE